LLALESYKPEKVEANLDIKKDCLEIEIEGLKKEELEIDAPDISGPVNNLPWVEDEDFLKAQKKHNTPDLMAAYCAVLIDPLPGEEYNVNLAANSIKGIVLSTDEIFSQNKMIGPYTKERGYRKGASFAGPYIVETEGGGVCKIASTLYNVAILSDLEIIERHNHSMPVNYVPYGQDATVAYGYKDFRFKNDKDFSILIWSEIIGNRLYIGFYGQEASPKVEWQHKIINKVKAPIHYKNNPDLEEGEEKIILKGIDGATVETTVIIKYEDGRYKTKKLGISQYLPLPHVIEKNK
ncbi:VanW family protein, partial [Schnuerera sp.]|uniref:VanW family protein n=1 Tax=Schnuerera sp. TaxID=2794844 RepID=UPI002BC3BE4D